jgi:hypothetical protein
MRRVTLLSSGLRPISQSSSAYIHEAGRHQLSKSILLSQVLAASLERSYPKGLETIEKPLRSAGVAGLGVRILSHAARDFLE